jgi:hypothetical protein
MRPPILTYATIQSLLTPGTPHRRPRILAKRDPLRNVPTGDFTLADYSYDAADLCHADFANCELASNGKA